jgi:hypothetical protein
MQAAGTLRIELDGFRVASSGIPLIRGHDGIARRRAGRTGKAVSALVGGLEEHSKKITTPAEIARVRAIAANSESGIGKMIAEDARWSPTAGRPSLGSLR